MCDVEDYSICSNIEGNLVRPIDSIIVPILCNFVPRKDKPLSFINITNPRLFAGLALGFPMRF
jgi:hypothetical protein